MKYLRHFVYAALALSAIVVQAHADDPMIVNLTNQELTPAVRDCLKTKPLGNCLDQALSNSKVPTPSSATSINSLAQGWQDFLHSAFDSPKIFTQSSLAFAFGVDYNMMPVDPAEVLLDPNKRATDKAQGGNSVWVNHQIELAPGMTDGTLPASTGDPVHAASYFGGVFQTGGIFTLTKRHPFDQVYNQSFWGQISKYKTLARQALPDYLKVPTEITGAGLLPGEGFQMEGFVLLEIGIGPTFSLAATPAIPLVGAGLFASAGFVASLVRGHFSTHVEVQEDGTFRVLLERINEDSEKLDAQVNAGVIIGPLSFVKNLINLEVGLIHSRETLLDLAFDPHYPEAVHALREAYFGRYTEAQNLALQASAQYKGVREVAKSTSQTRTTERDLSILVLEKGSSNTHSDVDTIFVNPDPSLDEGSEDKTEMDGSDTHFSKGGKSRDLQITLRNDDPNPSQGQARSMNIKYNFKAPHPTEAESQQFADMAAVFGHSTNATNAPSATASKNIQGYFYLDLDSEDMSSIFSQSAVQLQQSFATAASQMPNAQAHMKEINAFAADLKKALELQDAEKQDQLLVKTLRGKGFDLYPIGVLALLVDRSHALAVEKFIGPDSPDSMDYIAVGDNYKFPSRIDN